jgi:hypothetical protein
MLFQDAPPDTSRYMIAGYAVFFAISIIYMVSLAVRRRNLEQDLQTLESMQAERKPSTAARKPKAAAKKSKSRR